MIRKMPPPCRWKPPNHPPPPRELCHGPSDCNAVQPPRARPSPIRGGVCMLLRGLWLPWVCRVCCRRRNSGAPSAHTPGTSTSYEGGMTCFVVFSAEELVGPPMYTRPGQRYRIHMKVRLPLQPAPPSPPPQAPREGKRGPCRGDFLRDPFAPKLREGTKDLESPPLPPSRTTRLPRVTQWQRRTTIGCSYAGLHYLSRLSRLRLPRRSLGTTGLEYRVPLVLPSTLPSSST